jgi:hypothetical protein
MNVLLGRCDGSRTRGASGPGGGHRGSGYGLPGPADLRHLLVEGGLGCLAAQAAIKRCGPLARLVTDASFCGYGRLGSGPRRGAGFSPALVTRVVDDVSLAEPAGTDR